MPTDLWKKVAPTTRLRKMGWLIAFFVLLAGFHAKFSFGSESCPADGEGCSTKAHSLLSSSYMPNDVGFLLCRTSQYPGLVPKLRVMLESLLNHSTIDLRFHVFACDEDGYGKAVEVLEEVSGRFGIETPQIGKQNITELLGDRIHLAKHLQTQVSRPGSYYHDQLFVLAPFLHLTPNVSRLIMLDVDLKFLADVKRLFAEFDNFPEKTFFGIAPELSPVYYHMLYKYRKDNPGTPLGGTEPKQMQGVNSGVFLVDVEKARTSLQEYEQYLEPKAVDELFKKYQVNGRGNLGDQDFLAVLSFERPDFFHFLDCGWNRALCQFWRKVYPDLFDAYFFCDQDVKIYHGNCDSAIPNS